MKTRVKILIGLAVVLSLGTGVYGQGTGFTYQGRLNSSGNPASGNYDFRFKLFVDSFGNTQAGITVVTNGVPVTNGLFTVAIDFGAGMFMGTSYWLEVGVRTNGASSYTDLAPLQALTPSPYAIFANSASNAATATTATSATTATTATTASAVGANGVNNVAIQNNAVTAAKIVGGQVVKSLNGLQDAVTLSAGTNVTITPSGQTVTIAASAGGWSLTGNAGTTPTNNFIGTTDIQPVEVRVNGQRALRLEPGTSGAPNVIGGAPVNFVASGVTGATIGGGGAANNSWTNSVTGNYGTVGGGIINIAGVGATVGGGEQNTASGDEATVGGGSGNKASSENATVGGGDNNWATNTFATVGGGSGNTANGQWATVGGGGNNQATDNSASVGGGHGNTASGQYATVSGGQNNQATNICATVAGGWNNLAGGTASFAAGRNAQAINTDSFVWGDGSATTASITDDSVTFRASGGYRFFTSSGIAGAQLRGNETSWITLSDRKAKKNFQPVDTVAVLDKLATMPIQQWNYKWENDTDVPNIGPMAQDFIHAFYPGRDDTGISTLQFDGVELAAIQGLNRKLEERETEIQALKERLDKLERAISSSTGNH
jgi:hypothetical protein